MAAPQSLAPKYARNSRAAATQTRAVLDLERSAAAFTAALQKYFKDAETQSENNTDEVGYTKSKCKKDRKCAP